MDLPKFRNVFSKRPKGLQHNDGTSEVLRMRSLPYGCGPAKSQLFLQPISKYCCLTCLQIWAGHWSLVRHLDSFWWDSDRSAQWAVCANTLKDLNLMRVHNIRSCDASYIPSKQGFRQEEAYGCSKMTRRQEQCRGTGCNLQDVRSNGDMQADKHNTKTAR